MAKNVLFLIHGSGLQGEGWAKAPGGPIETLQKAAGGYSFFKGKDLTALLDLVPIRYDDVFERVLESWQDFAKKIQENAGGGSQEALNFAVNLTGEVGGNRAGFLGKGGDLLLYKGLRLIARRVQLRVASRLAGTIAERTASAGGQPPRFSVAAHGLGTAVAHDALHLLATESWTDDDAAAEDRKEAVADRSQLRRARKGTAGVDNPFAPEVFRFDSLFLCDDLSGLLHAIPQGPGESLVRPALAPGDRACLRHYYSFRHRDSPLPQIGAFAMPDAWKKAGAGFAVTDLDHVYGRDLSAFGHTLLHPKVHLALLANTIDGFDPGAEGPKAISGFPSRGAGFQGRDGQRVEDKWSRLSEKAEGKDSLARALWIARRVAALVQEEPAAPAPQ